MIASVQQRKAAAKHWDQQLGSEARRFWQFPTCIRHINRCMGVDSPVWGGAIHHMLAKRPKAKTAISVGCGVGIKELRLIQLGLVEHFDLFEISQKRLDLCRSNFAARGLTAKADLSSEDGLAALVGNKYDLVHWDSSLHHMPDVKEALALSAKALNTGGVVVVNEFVGPNRFQWPDEQLAIVNSFRSKLPDRFFDPKAGAALAVARQVKRPTIEQMMAADPSESADSDAILPAIRELFPFAPIWQLGGLIYHLGMNDVLANFRLPEDEALLNISLLLDSALSDAGHNQFAASIMTKD